MTHTYSHWRWIFFTVFTVLGLMCCFLLISRTVNAASVDFSVKTEDKKSPAAVQRQITAGQVFTVKLLFTNNSAHSQNLSISCNTAFTGDTGNVQYNLENPKPSYFGSVNFNQLINGPKTVKLAAHGKVVKNYTIKSPDKKFKGVVVGGFYVRQIVSKRKLAKTSKNKMAMGYTNVFAYVIPVILSQSNQIVHTKLVLQKTYSKVTHNIPVVIARIANVTPTFFGELSFKTRIVNVKNHRVMSKSSQNNMTMAPLSRFDYHVLLKKPLPAGKYLLNLTATSGQRIWHFDRTFQISQHVAQSTESRRHTSSDQWKLWLAVILGLIVLLVALSVGMYELGRHHKNSKK